MLHISMPDNNQLERQYIAEILFGEFLGIDFRISFLPQNKNIVIKWKNESTLIIEDHFFVKYSMPLEYLHQTNLPNTVSLLTKSDHLFPLENDITVLYGIPQIIIKESCTICSIDIFAGAFLMLSRWEEYVNPVRDLHQRFPAKESVAFKHGFLQQPIVDQYAELLWRLLQMSGFNSPRKQRQFKVLITHDVDLPLLWPNWKSVLKKTVGDIAKRHNLREAWFSIASGYKTRFCHKKDPYDTFDYLMDCSEQIGTKAHFFFLSGGNSKYDISLPLEVPFMKKLIEKIKDRGHIIGIHPSYNSFNKSDLFRKEKTNLENKSGQQITIGRQHFLRFQIPETWQMWEDAGMEWDSSVYYPSMVGFRCGTCHPFSVFNILSRKKLKLKERPIIAMEVTWTNYLKSTPEEMWDGVNTLIDTVKKYNGTFILLWHNSSFNTPFWKPYEPVYGKILKAIKVNMP